MSSVVVKVLVKEGPFGRQVRKGRSATNMIFGTGILNSSHIRVTICVCIGGAQYMCIYIYIYCVCVYIQMG